MATTSSGERSRHSPTRDLGPHAQRAQVVRELVGPRVQLAVGERVAVADSRATASGVRAGLGLEELVDARPRAG